MLVAGPSRSIPLSPHRWTDGAAAAASLAICSEPVEFVCEVELTAEQIIGPILAEAVYASDGTLLRPGGGQTYLYRGEVLAFDAPPLSIGLESP